MGIETLIGAGTSLVGGLMQSDAAGDAADAQAGATAASIAEQRRQFDLTRGDYAPYRFVGTNALRRLAALYGIETDGGNAGVTGGMTEAQIRQMLTPQYTTPGMPGGSRDINPEYSESYGPTPSRVDQAALDLAVSDRMGQQSRPGGQTVFNDGLDGPLQMDPGYQFGMQQGQQALDRKTAAAGGRVSGAALKAATRFGTDYATSGYGAAYQRRQDSINRLASLAGIGQSATGASAAAGSNAANNISGALQSQGDATGAARLAQGNIWTNALNQGAASWQRRNPSQLSGPSNSDLASMYNFG